MYLLGALLAGCAGPVSLDSGNDEAVTAASSTDVDCEVGIAVGDCAPDFTLPDADGANVSLSDFPDKLILINCSAEW